MSKLLRALAAACLLAAAQPSHAIFRVYLSLAGSDSNPCTLGSPCRTMAPALAAVDSGGEIWMVDSANYNVATVNITKSVTIQALPGAIGSILALNGPAFSINTAGVKVTLRRLVIKGVTGFNSTNGVNVGSAGSVTIDNCELADLGQGVSATGVANILIIDSVVRNSADVGLYIESGPTVSVVRTTMAGNPYSIFAASAGAASSLSVRDSILSANLFHAVWVSANTNGAMKAAISNSQITDSPAGFGAGSSEMGTVKVTLSGNLVANNGGVGMMFQNSGTTALLSENTITGNGLGLTISSGALVTSPGTNIIQQNGGNIGGTLGTFTKN